MLTAIPIIIITNKSNTNAPRIHFQTYCFSMNLTVANIIKLRMMHPDILLFLVLTIGNILFASRLLRISYKKTGN